MEKLEFGDKKKKTRGHSPCAPPSFPQEPTWRLAAHLDQRLLHGTPVGDPPGAFQHQVGVAVAFGLAVLGQRLPLVQLLGAAAQKQTLEPVKVLRPFKSCWPQRGS